MATIPQYQPRNVYTPSRVAQTPSSGLSLASASLSPTSISSSLTQVKVDFSDSYRYIQEQGRTNPLFRVSTAGRLIAGNQQPITRGYIRRADPSSSNPMSDAVLLFMYNPERIQQQYASYLDQAAIDPFNTIFQSGNLVAPPSIVQFDFDMLFDREIEAVNGSVPSGCLVDKTYYDMVVRNVSPNSSGPNDVPDNGVMMVNPEDITVVFSENLTVQGRPINSTVEYQRFTNAMVPTRMAISLTMIVNYFGPLRDPFGLDTAQQIASYSALVPYDNIPSPYGITLANVQVGIKTFQDEYAANQAGFAARLASAQNWWGGSSTDPTTASLNMTAPVNDDIKSRALAAAQFILATGNQLYGGTKYSQGKRTQVPEYADCSSFVWRSYQGIGAQSVFGPSQWPNTASMFSYWKSTNWATMTPVLSWSSGSKTIASQLVAIAQPGDLLFVSNGSNNHIAFVQSVSGSTITTLAANSSTSKPQVGAQGWSSSSAANFFQYLLRPAATGSQTAGGSRMGRNQF